MGSVCYFHRGRQAVKFAEFFISKKIEKMACINCTKFLKKACFLESPTYNGFSMYNYAHVKICKLLGEDKNDCFI